MTCHNILSLDGLVLKGGTLEPDCLILNRDSLSLISDLRHRFLNLSAFLSAKEVELAGFTYPHVVVMKINPHKALHLC